MVELTVNLFFIFKISFYLQAKEAEIRAAIQKEKQIKKDKQLKMLETRHKKEVKDENNKQQNTSEQKRWFW